MQLVIDSGSFAMSLKDKSIETLLVLHSYPTLQSTRKCKDTLSKS